MHKHIAHISYIPLFFPFLGSYGCRRGLKSTKNGQVWRLFFGFVSNAEINRVRTGLELSVTVILACIAILLHFLATMGHKKRMQWLKVKFIKLCIMSCRFFFQTMPGGNCYQNVKLWKKNECKIQVKMKWKLRCCKHSYTCTYVYNTESVKL